MVRIFGWVVTVLMTAGLALAQGGVQPPAQRPPMAGMHEQHDKMMKEMQANLDNMRATVQKMKDQLAKVSDASAREQLSLNISLWESMVNGMDKHMHMMQGMMDHMMPGPMGMGHGEGMDHGRMGDHHPSMGQRMGCCRCCGGDGTPCGSKPEAPAKPQAPAAPKP